MKARLWVVLVSALAMPVAVFAQESVDARVQRLEETVRVLQAQVASLEAQLRERKASAPVAVPKGKEGWRKLEHGMSERDVEQLLGSPDRVNTNPVTTTWQYGLGSVRFDSRSREVEAWSEP